MRRSALLLLCSALAFAVAPRAGAPVPYPMVRVDEPVVLPRDAGAHPEFRTEWWYVTGWLEAPGGESLGFQVTFFRTRPPIAPEHPSAFAARQVLIAHAALSDPTRGRLWHDQRIARDGFGRAAAAVGPMAVHIGDWRLEETPAGIVAVLVADGFALDLVLGPEAPGLLNGERGYSRKGPSPASASHYYSQPQLRVRGSVRRGERRVTVAGRAWLDHEWSSAYLGPEAAGWDWVGLNLADGGALMAFRIRDRQGAPHWAGATVRAADGSVRVYGPDEVVFTAGRRWRSPRTGIDYPVAWQVRVGPEDYALAPLLDDQESDSRPTTGAIYWEGAVTATGRRPGRGYLELTGYGEPLKLP